MAGPWIRALSLAVVALVAAAGLARAHSYAWAVGSDGLILRSETGGATWEQVESGTTADLNAVAFSNQLYGIAVGGETLYSRDGGLTWAKPTTGIGIADVTFVDDETAIGVGPNGRICHAQFTLFYWGCAAPITSATLNAIDFGDDQHGWAVGDAGTILHTSNGGTSWSAQTSGTTEPLRDVAFADASHGWAVGDLGTILHTSDGGSTWSPQTSGTTLQLLSVSFADASNGLVGGVAPLLRTTDGGATWSPAVTDPMDPIEDGLEEIRDLLFLDGQRGTAIGYPPRAFHTSDAGAKWDLRADPLPVFGLSSLNGGAVLTHAEHGVGPDPCRSQCELAAPSCDEQPRSALPNFAAQRQQLIDLYQPPTCPFAGFDLVEGTCAGGDVRFLHSGGSIVRETRFYDAQTLLFTGYASQTDFVGFPCSGAGYWPGPVTCPDPTVTQVHCGTTYAVDDPIPMPVGGGTIPVEGGFAFLEGVPAVSRAGAVVLGAGVVLAGRMWLRRRSLRMGRSG